MFFVPLDGTILPRISTPSVVMLPAALMDFSPATEQSNTTFTNVLLMVTWSCMGEREQGTLETFWSIFQILYYREIDLGGLRIYKCFVHFILAGILSL